MNIESSIPEFKRYNNLDGIRAMAALGIIFMHVRSNIGYKLVIQNNFINYLINHIIASMGIFVQLFFIISGFSMCCGYYEKIKQNNINFKQFYNKRYIRILPFFALLVTLDLCIDLIFNKGFEISNIFEGFTDITLLFGLFPTTNLTVIGVGWTLGVIFGFYILFPFFVYLIWDKKKAWKSLIIFLCITFICNIYYSSLGIIVDLNTIYWFYCFITGGLIYLYKDNIKNFYERMKTYKVLFGTFLVIVGFYVVFVLNFSTYSKVNLIKNLFGFSLIIIGVIGYESKIWSNKIAKFISSISFEIYLSHMMIFRLLQKIGITTIYGNNVISYIICCLLTIVGSIIFSQLYKLVYKKCQKGIMQYVK